MNVDMMERSMREIASFQSVDKRPDTVSDLNDKRRAKTKRGSCDDALS